MTVDHIKDLIAKEKRLAEGLIAEADAHYEGIEPVDVPVVFGDTEVIFKLPFLHPAKFNELADRFPPRPGVAVDGALWFSLDQVARNYPGVTLEVNGEVDDLYRVRNQRAEYIFSELYGVMPPEDAQSIRMAVWALNIWEPQQRHQPKKTTLAEEANDG